MEQVIVEQKAVAGTKGNVPPPILAISPEATPSPKGMRKGVIPLDEGDVTLMWPANLSPESYDDLESHLQLIIKRAKRRAEIERDAVKKLAATYDMPKDGAKD
jgi:hypothetical protein